MGVAIASATTAINLVILRVNVRRNDVVVDAGPAMEAVFATIVTTSDILLANVRMHEVVVLVAGAAVEVEDPVVCHSVTSVKDLAILLASVPVAGATNVIDAEKLVILRVNALSPILENAAPIVLAWSVTAAAKPDT